MWNDKKPWWEKRRKDNQGSKTHYKDWCVIKLANYYHDINNWEPRCEFLYKAVAKSNAPHYWNPDTGKYEVAVEVDNLTKHEAHCVAKGLNFLDT